MSQAPELWPPLDHFHITSPFGLRKSPITGKREGHPGIDLRAAEGTPVYAAAAGKVTRAYKSDDSSLHAAGFLSYGTRICIDHGDGFETSYAHLSKRQVFAGMTVKAGDLIGYSGATGDCRGAHLHFELRHNGEAQDPMPHFVARPEMSTGRATIRS